MTNYQLKKNQPAFDIVDGPQAGQKFSHKTTYTELPKGYESRFEAIKAAKPAKTAPKTGDNK